ncbi:MAG: FAD-dependent oxidoreductase [Gammaproteobacteria bacterium]|nr:FAD-dependent oxidoreductase [Gammaproteobacteria bacterium]MDD9894844.1 FAD-dependent oxidoreductase [Gammaproteobacteria bacterium]MDD9958246.1 FAD-dependent oxidoreductase [Gammaproteobacteria bacterium]
MTDKKINKIRRRVITGLGAVAASSLLPRRLSAQRSNDTDVLIIGGGIAGSSTAFHLAEQGRDVILLERGDIASEASGQNMGGLGGSGWGNNPDLLSYLTAGSVEIFKRMQIDMDYDIEFRLSGTLTAIHSDAQYEFYQDDVASQRNNGYEIELLSAREARAIEPEANGALPGYMYRPQRGQADPVKTTRAFAHAAQIAGATVNTGQNVVSITPMSAGGYLIQTESTEFRCQTLVLATGAWCGPVGEMLGLRIPIVPVRGQMWATESLPMRIMHTIGSTISSYAWSKDNGSDNVTPPNLTHKNGRRNTRHLYGRQSKNGEIIFGGDRESLGYNTTPNPAGIEVNRDHAAEVIPLVASLPIARTWAGLMPFSLDGAPVIGKIPIRDNLFIVSGMASSGFGRGPMAGKLAADYIHSGNMTHVLAESDPARCVTEK